jgi:hypothetical protein
MMGKYEDEWLAWLGYLGLIFLFLILPILHFTGPYIVSSLESFFNTVISYTAIILIAVILIAFPWIAYRIYKAYSLATPQREKEFGKLGLISLILLPWAFSFVYSSQGLQYFTIGWLFCWLSFYRSSFYFSTVLNMFSWLWYLALWYIIMFMLVLIGNLLLIARRSPKIGSSLIVLGALTYVAGRICLAFRWGLFKTSITIAVPIGLLSVLVIGIKGLAIKRSWLAGGLLLMLAVLPELSLGVGPSALAYKVYRIYARVRAQWVRKRLVASMIDSIVKEGRISERLRVESASLREDEQILLLAEVKGVISSYLREMRIKELGSISLDDLVEHLRKTYFNIISFALEAKLIDGYFTKDKKRFLTKEYVQSALKSKLE